MSKRDMTYGDVQAMKVLAAEHLGLNPSCLDIAKDQLNGKPVHPMFSAQLSKVATEMHNQIALDETLIARANEAFTEIQNQYFPIH